MKKQSLRILLSATLLAGFTFACKDELLAPAGEDAATSSVATENARRGSPDVDYQVSQQVSGNTWTYTITKSSASKHPGHFIINFGNCDDASPTLANIVSAKVNGADWLGKIEASEGATGCVPSSSNFVKFDDLDCADQYIIEFTLDTLYAAVPSQGWIKAGRSCTEKGLIAPGCRGYILTTTLGADASMAGKPYNELNSYMKQYGFDYSEHPNCSGGYGGHIDGIHGDVVNDIYFNKSVFRFDIHIDPVIDGDRCSSGTVDRQRNEMKSITNNTTWAKVQGNWNEWQILEWKFKLPAGFQPTQNFCHIHQLKAQDGPNNGSPVITITPRANSDGSNRRMQIIHSVDGASTGKGTVVNDIPLSAFEDEWVQVREEMHYTHNGYYSCKITRIRDGQVLIDYTDGNIDMWRIGSSYIRHKYGIYRSLSGGRLDQNPVGQSPLLKNESILITDFRVYEKNTNPEPGVAH